MLRQGHYRLLHWLFEASLAIKGFLCAAETLAGLGLLLTPNPLIARLVFCIQHFYAWYLLAHGGLKLTMVFMLWRRVLWAYPAAMVVLTGFVIYQTYEFVHAGSPFLLVLALFDLVMIGLVWQEWRALRGKTPSLSRI
jgi:uncharacterized membrane protein